MSNHGVECDECGHEMMALWTTCEHPVQRSYTQLRKRDCNPIVPTLECAYCGYFYVVCTDFELMSWVQSVTLGEGSR